MVTGRLQRPQIAEPSATFPVVGSVARRITAASLRSFASAASANSSIGHSQSAFNKSPVPVEINSIVPKDYRYKGHVALFIGSDVTSHLIANHIIPKLIKMQYKPVIFLPAHKHSSKPEAKLDICQDFNFYQRGLLSQIVYPYLNRNEPLLDKEGKPLEGINYSLQQLAQLYDLTIADVADVNDPSFIERLVTDRIVGAINIRGYQKFKAPFIQKMKDENAFFLNLHPGQLPQYRGLFGPLYAMGNGETSFGWTLHVIDEDYDRGPIVDVNFQNINYAEPAINLYLNFAEEGGRMIMHALNLWVHDYGFNNFVPSVQNEEQARYYSYPKKEDYDRWINDFILIDPDEMVQFYMSKYTIGDSNHGHRFFNELEDAIKNYNSERLWPGNTPDEEIEYPGPFPTNE